MFTEIICIIDRSGSMEVIKNDAIGGFNTFLKQQKKEPGEATLTLIQFNHQYEVVHENKPLKDVPKLDDKTYQPTGMTALLDAVGRAIETTKKRLSGISKKKRPAKVIVAILTDGEENSSREYKVFQIRDMIKKQKKKHSWEFIFLGANQDAFAEAGKIGIDARDTMSFLATPKGVRDAYDNMGRTTTEYRTK